MNAMILSVLVAAVGLGENRRNPGWAVTDAARARLAALAEAGKAWKPHTETIRIFCRNQMKYGANRSDYLHKWYERPLYQNTAWQVADDPDVLVNPLAWNEETVRFARAGLLDGFAACPTQIGREWLIPRSVQKGGEITAYLELPYGYHEGSLEKYLRVAEMAYRMPNAFRIDGKIVLTRYPIVDLKDLDRAEELRRALDAKYGKGAFIVLYYVRAFEGGLPNRALDVADIARTQDYLRQVLRKTDGLFYAGWDVFWPRRYDRAFEEGVLVPIFRATLAEPEFAGRKYLGMPLTQGHANCYRWGYSLDSNGTQMLVDRMRAMEALRPDFVLACEWDEENENTHFRPTVSSGTTNMRLTRCFADRYAGRPPTKWPEDRDFSRPNLVVSYRKSLVAGEPAEVEVRNIPDGSFAGETFDVAFAWRTADGREAASFAPRRLAADDVGAVRFVCRASALAPFRAVVPELTVRSSKGVQTFSDGLWPLDVHATRQVDSWWIKTPLRDMGEATGLLTCEGPDATGAYTIRGRVASRTRLRSVEVLEGPDTVFMSERVQDDRTKAERFVIDIQGHVDCQRFEPPVGPCRLDGTIRLEGAPHATLSEPVKFTTPGAKAIEPWKLVTRTGQTYTFKGASIRPQPFVFALEMPSDEARGAVVKVDLGSFAGEIRLADVLAKDAVSLVGPCGGNFVVRRGLTQGEIPKALDANEATFAFRIRPIDGGGVLRLQTVDENLHVWRSRPYRFFGGPTGTNVTYRVFERDEEEVSEVTLDRSLVPEEIRYDFADTGRGGVIPALGLGRAHWGILGGYCPQVNGIGRGEADYGNSLRYQFTTNVPGFKDTAPTRAAGPCGTAAFAFTNANHITFPQQVVPTFAAWSVEMDVCPDDVAGTSVLFGAGAAAFKMRLVAGVPTLEYFSAVGYARRTGAVVKATGPRLAARRWHRLRFVCDQRTLFVEVDGVRGTEIPFAGYVHQQRYTELGVGNHDLRFFRGKIANLVIRIPTSRTDSSR